MATVVFLVLLVGTVLTLGMRKAPIAAWAVAAGLLTWICHTGILSGGADGGYSSIFTAILTWLPFTLLALLSVPVLRRQFLVEPAYAMVKGILPKVSDTEAQALEALPIGISCRPFRRSS
jgi:acyl-CoA dehydrogenase